MKFSPFLGQRVKYKIVIAFCLLSLLPSLVFILTLQEYHLFFKEMTYISFYCVFLLILMGYCILLKIADNIRRLEEAVKISREKKTSVNITSETEHEFMEIADHFNRMQNELSEISTKLENSYRQSIVFAEDLINTHQISVEESNMRNEFQRYLSPNLVQKVTGGQSAEIPGMEQGVEATILFVDIRGFTQLCEEMDTKEIRTLLNEFYTLISKTIFHFKGSVEKFLGDSVMGAFGIPLSHPDDAVRAVRTALEIQKKITQLGKRVGTGHENEQIQVGIGVNTGLAVLGSFGSDRRMDFTMIGNSVNIAAKLQEKAEGGQILVGEKTYEKVKHLFPVSYQGKMVDPKCGWKVRYFEVRHPNEATV